MEFVFDYQMLNLGIGLLGLIVINVLLGSISAILNGEFDKEKLIKGIIKGGIISISFVGVYIVGTLVPDISIIIDGQELTLIMAVSLILTGGFGFYAVEVISKLSSFVNAKIISK